MKNEVGIAAATQEQAPPNAPIDSDLEQIDDTPAPYQSFTALLLAAAADDDDTDSDLSRITDNQREGIARMIQFHCDLLMQILAGRIHSAAEEAAAEKLAEKELQMEAMMDKNSELERKMTKIQAEAERLKLEMRNVEHQKEALRKTLKDCIERRRHGERVHEDAASSMADNCLVEPVRLVCVVCRRRPANVVIWPCRHLCVCRGCEAVTVACPVCDSVKSYSCQIHLPLE